MADWEWLQELIRATQQSDGVARWNDRIAKEREKSPNYVVDLSKMGREMIHVDGFDLRRIVFSGSSMDYATMNGCDLSQSNFTGVQLQSGSLRKANLANVSFENAVLCLSLIHISEPTRPY